MYGPQKTNKMREPEIDIPRNVDSDSNDDNIACIDEPHRRKSWRTQSLAIGQHKNHHHHDATRDLSCVRCEQPRYDIAARDLRRRKKSRSQTQHCPSCFCDPGEHLTRSSHGRSRNTGNLDAGFERYKHLLVSETGQKSPGDDGPSATRKFAGGRILPETSSNYRRTDGDRFPRNRQIAEQNPLLSGMMKDMVDCGLASEETEIRGNYAQFAPIKSVFKKDARCSQQHQVAESMRENGEDETENDWQRLEDERRQLENDRQELSKLNRELRAYEKWKESGKRSSLASNAEVGFLEKRKSSDGAVDEQQKSIKTIGPVTSKLPVPRGSLKKQTSAATRSSPERAEKNGEQAKNKDSPKIEENATYRCSPTVCRCDSYDNVAVDDVADFKEEDTPEARQINDRQKVKRMPPYKTTEEKSNDERREDEDETGKNLYAAGDLDLHASKSYILGLIDRALSREFGTFPEEKKNDVPRPFAAPEEGKFEEIGGFHGDCSTPQQLIERREYVKQAKSLRWQYLNHIQEDLKTLSEIERFLDGCSSPRLSMPNFSDEKYGKERQKQQQQQQERQSTTTNL